MSKLILKMIENVLIMKNMTYRHNISFRFGDPPSKHTALPEEIPATHYCSTYEVAFIDRPLLNAATVLLYCTRPLSKSISVLKWSHSSDYERLYKISSILYKRDMWGLVQLRWGVVYMNWDRFSLTLDP